MNLNQQQLFNQQQQQPQLIPPQLNQQQLPYQQYQQYQQQDLIDFQQQNIENVFQQANINENICYQQNNYQQQIYNKSGKVTLIKQENEDLNLELSAIIVTICEGGSYDSLFTSVKQESPQGTRVRIYQTDYNGILNQIFKALKAETENINDYNEKENENEKEKDDDLIELLQDLKKIKDKNNIVFNFECCSGCNESGFIYSSQFNQQEQEQESMNSVIKFLIDSQYFLMFSDFSLKGLIGKWNEQLLGPKPFKQIGSMSGQFDLAFDKKQLQNCDSAQLAKVGDLSAKEQIQVHAMGGTIVYSVDFDQAAKANQKYYDLEILTVVPSISGKPVQEQFKDYQPCEIGKNQGAAGHVMLSYKSGGKLLTSMGHWIELMKIDTDAETLFKIAERDYGESYAQNMKCQYDQMDAKEQSLYVNTNAVQFVQQSAPCQNFKKC